MAKERSEAERAERKAKKLKEKSGKNEIGDKDRKGHKSTPAEDFEGFTTNGAVDLKSEKKEKKRKKDPADLDGASQKKMKQDYRVGDDSDEDGKQANGVAEEPVVPLLAFAEPLADSKQKHKILKAIRRGVKHKTLKRGVKEITKAARKTADSTPIASADDAPAIAIIAGDVWPEDVVAHIPVQCEEKNIPFIFVNSRKELGEAGATKRPTSCLLLVREVPKKQGTEQAKSDDDDKESWDDTFKSVLKMVNKERARFDW